MTLEAAHRSFVVVVPLITAEVRRSPAASWIALMLGCWLATVGCSTTSTVEKTADPSTASGVGWRELTIETSTGPCAPDGRSCFVKTHVFPDGTVNRDAYANPTPEQRLADPDAPKFTTTTYRLAPADAKAVDQILRSKDFQRDMRAHFACARPAFDANITFEVVFADGSVKQDVTTCVIDPSTQPNGPGQLVDLSGKK